MQKIRVAQTIPKAIAQPIFPDVSVPLWVKNHAAEVPDRNAMNEVIAMVAPIAPNFLWSVLHFSNIGISAPAIVHNMR